MINHFNAFISYKHAELDNKIAASIVRDLEHFHVPRKIQKSTGVKKIERIFRDKDELPITSDLGDTISQALYNADYLIVICSHNTKNSTWVEREIEYFLKNHSMDKILTVLCEGEPSEVIPKVLLSGKRTFKDEEGNEHTQEIPFEPLSCDYRLPYRKAKAEELPRLAAALIGCSYDELINRQRQYKMRRMSAIFAGAMALSLGFAGYMLYSNSLIQKNYLESLKNQSRYLANESEKLLDDENRIEAMQLALAALPADEEDPRPVTPEAIRAISKASYAYVTLEGSNISAAWNYKMPNHVSDFKLSEKGTYFAAIDVNGVVIAWDTKEHKKIIEEDNFGDKANTIYFAGDDKLVIFCEKSISAFDLTSGKNIWKLEESNFQISIVKGIFDYSDDSILVVDSLGRCGIISVSDGSVKKSFEILDEEAADNCVLRSYALSGDKKKIAFFMVDRNDFINYIYNLCEYDIESGELTSKETGENWILNIEYLGDRLYASCSESDTDGSVQMYNYNFVTEEHTLIRCFSSGDLVEKWNYDFVSTDVNVRSGFLTLETGDIAYYESNVCRVFDAETGEVLGDYNANDSIVDVSDNDGDGVPLFITRSGASGTPTTMGETQGVALITRFPDELNTALVGGGVYTLSDMSSEVIYYGTKVCDDEWNKIDGVPAFKTSNGSYLDEDILAILADEGDGAKLLFVNPEDKTYKGEAVISESSPAYRFTLLGSFGGSFYAAVCADHVLDMIKVDLETLKVETETVNPEYSGYDPIASMGNGKLIYVDSTDYTDYTIVERDLTTGEEKKIPYPQKITDIIYFTDTGFVYVKSEVDSVVNLADSSVTDMELGEEWGETKCVATNKKGDKMAVCNGEVIRLMDDTGAVYSEISCRNVEPLNIAFFEEGEKEFFLSAYKNGMLYRYDPKSGEFVGNSDLTVYSSSFMYDADFDYDSESGLLYIRTGDILDIIETDSWVEITSVIGTMGCDKKTDTIFSYGYETTASEGMIGWFEHYSVDRLIEKTRNYLRGEEMSKDKKSMYGIG